MKKRLILVPFFMVAMTGASPSGMEPIKPKTVKEVSVNDKLESINLSIQDANKLDYKP